MQKSEKAELTEDQLLKRCCAEEMRLTSLIKMLVICDRKDENGICMKEGDCRFRRIHLYIRRR